MWVQKDVCGLFADNVGPSAENVGPRRYVFADNVGSIAACLWARGITFVGCEFYHLMRLDKQTCDWHNKKCNSLYVTQDISKGARQAAGNAVALIRVKNNPVATNNVASRIFQCEKWL